MQGHYQGACIPFRQGLGSGSLSLQFAKDGSLFVGGTNRGWGSRGAQPYSLDRIVWTGKTPFEVEKMEAQPDGFRLTFTQPVDPVSLRAADALKLTSYTYKFQSSYGSDEIDPRDLVIRSIDVAPDARSARLIIDGLREGFVHELHLPGVRSATSEPLLHDAAYYTLNAIP